MNKSATRQQQFRERMLASGRRQASFLLSEQALQVIKSHAVNATMSEALESLVTASPMPRPSITEHQMKILDVVSRLGEVARQAGLHEKGTPEHKALSEQYIAIFAEVRKLSLEV